MILVVIIIVVVVVTLMNVMREMMTTWRYTRYTYKHRHRYTESSSILVPTPTGLHKYIFIHAFRSSFHSWFSSSRSIVLWTFANTRDGMRNPTAGSTMDNQQRIRLVS